MIILLRLTFFVRVLTCLLQDIVRHRMTMLILGMYAASANLVLTTGIGNGVNGFTLDNALGEFILTHPNVYSINFKFTVDAHSKETRYLLCQ
jgi:fructose-1,6-bisphosphatase